VRDLEQLPQNTDMKALGAWYDWANQLTKEDLMDLRKIIHGSGKFMLCHNGDTWTGEPPYAVPMFGRLHG